MPHIIYTKASRIAKSDEGWYEVTRQVGKEANRRARRTDITSVISETCGMGAPACFIPALAELHLNTTKVPFGDPTKVDLSDRLWCLDHPAAVGALCHEAAHARHTKWDEREFTEAGANRRMMDVIVTLEEPRIERNAVDFDAGSRVFLRGCAMEIVAADFKVKDTPYGASVAAGLILAREDAGILSRAEVEPFRRDIVAVLGEDTLGILRALWRRFLRLHDTDYAGMVAVAREWLEALGLDPEAEEGEDEGQDDGSDLGAGSLFGEPEPGDGEGEGEGSGGDGDGESSDGEGEGKSLSDRITEGSRKVAAKVDQEVTERRGAERAARRAAERKADAKRRAEGSKAHDKVFPPGHGYGTGGDSRLVKVRQPTGDERRAALALARDLEQIHFHDRTSVRTANEAPPGRLRGRALVGNAAGREAGNLYGSPAWAGRKHRVVPETPLTMALLNDVSGSMGGAQAPLASTQWICANAGDKIGAKVTTVHFGEKARGRMRAGQRQKDVMIYRANDGFEAFRDAALAADQEVNLLDGRGARLLIVSSDGQFVDDDHEAYARAFIPLALRKGVGVLWLQFTSSLTTYGATSIDCRGLTPVQVATLVGRAAVAEMRKADQSAQGL